MNKAAGHRSRPGIEILVIAPDGKIDSPVMQLQYDISGGMSQIITHHAALLPGPIRQSLQIKELAGEKIDPVDEDEGDFLPPALQYPVDVMGMISVLPRPRDQWHQGVRWIVAVQPNLRLQSIQIRRKHWFVDQNSVTILSRSVKRRQHQVEIDGQAIHHDDFAGSGADEVCPGFSAELVIVVP